MDYFLKALGVSIPTGKKDHLTRIQVIEQLKKQLVQEGYQPSEAEHFVKLAAGSISIGEMGNKDLDQVIERLESQIRIAQKCKELFK
ncbi:MAG: hypothetical protein ACOY35_02250 [Bacillota bacterium]